MSEQKNTRQFPIYFGYGDDIAEKPQAGVASIADVMAFLCDAVVNADIMDNITKQGRDGLYTIMQASQRQLEVMADVIAHQEPPAVKPEGAKPTPKTYYPKVALPLLHKNQVADLSKTELLMLVNNARGHTPKAAAMAVGIDNSDLTKMSVRLEKRGLIDKPDEPEQDSAQSA